MMTRIPKIKEKGILIDTCILLTLRNKQLRRAILGLLTKLSAKNSLAVSEITFFEIFRRQDMDQEEREWYRKVLKKRAIKTLRITPLIISNASILCRCAHPEQETKNKEIACDMLIGGTVMENLDGLLLTSDRADFAMPFWETVHKTYFVGEGKTGDNYKLIPMYLLRFNYCQLDPEFLPRELKEQCESGQQNIDF